jgi:glyoxylase-like metal-dependent hydrolase (beta-lactamase superfamily II)
MDVALVLAGNPGALTGAGSNTWLLDGRVPTLVDAGVGAASHVDAVAGRLAGRRLAQVLVTHGHHDHAGGVPALRAAWPDLVARKFVAGDEPAWIPLADGEVVAAGDGALSVVWTPGHAPDHVCFWDQGSASLFGGDMVIAGTTVMIPAGRGGSLRDYLASLDRLARLAPRRIYPGHGPVIERPLELIREYLAHRALRERQILDCLERGIVEPDAIVAAIYGNLATPVFRAARETVEAHLVKLAGDGRLPPGIGPGPASVE